jgi:hypothetical protein
MSYIGQEIQQLLSIPNEWVRIKRSCYSYPACDHSGFPIPLKLKLGDELLDFWPVETREFKIPQNVIEFDCDLTELVFVKFQTPQHRLDFIARFGVDNRQIWFID